MFLLDTTVVSELRRLNHAAPAVTEWAASVAVADLYLSAMTLYELELGVQRLERRDERQGELLRSWLTRIACGAKT